MTEADYARGARLAQQEQGGMLGGIPAARRNAPKGLMPSTWTGRNVRVSYTDASGVGQSLSGQLLDVYPVGLVVGAEGCRQLLSWENFVICELIER